MAYLQTSGTKFVVNGSPIFLSGGSTYDISNSTAQVDSKHDQAVAMGLNIVRYVNWMSHSATAGTEFTEALWAVVDYGLNRAITDNLYVLLDLSDSQTALDHYSPLPHQYLLSTHASHPLQSLHYSPHACPVYY